MELARRRDLLGAVARCARGVRRNRVSDAEISRRSVGATSTAPNAPAPSATAAVPWHEYRRDARRAIEPNLRLARRLAPVFRGARRRQRQHRALGGRRTARRVLVATDAAARADARTLLLMRHGGLWIDADVLVARPLGAVRRLLERTSRYRTPYAARVAPRAPSANFVAARPGSAFWRRAWDAERRCPAAVPRGRRAPAAARQAAWGSTGMGVWHALAKMAIAGDPDLACFSAARASRPGAGGPRSRCQPRRQARRAAWSARRRRAASATRATTAAAAATTRAAARPSSTGSRTTSSRAWARRGTRRCRGSRASTPTARWSRRSCTPRREWRTGGVRGSLV